MIRRVRWTGDTRFAHDMHGRMAPEQVRRNVIVPWIRDVKGFYLAMFRAGGSVPGERGKWAANSEWTTAAKGHNKPMLSGRQYQFGAMVRSLSVLVIQRSRARFEFQMSNTARSNGFDYPSYLHAPGRRKRFDVLPHQKGGALKLVAPGGAVIFRAKTRPIKPKARPHIFWQERMVEAWGRRMLNWVLRGRVSARKMAA